MKKIVITGPEASAKSYLTDHLSQRLNAHKIDEYARWYLPTLPRPYDFNDLLAICRGQERAVQYTLSAMGKRDFVIIDTWAIVLMVWAEYKYDRTHVSFDALLERIDIDHYLLCAPDLPWEADPLRENPTDRDQLFERYQKKLEEHHLPYSTIEGKLETRIEHASQILKGL
jgi:nicotinamide riboside kinase